MGSLLSWVLWIPTVTTQSDRYDPSWHLSVQDITVDSVENPSWLQVKIKGSKTDQLKQGMVIVVGITSSHICPVKSVLAYIACRGFHYFAIRMDHAN